MNLQRTKSRETFKDREREKNREQLPQREKEREQSSDRKKKTKKKKSLQRKAKRERQTDSKWDRKRYSLQRENLLCISLIFTVNEYQRWMQILQKRKKASIRKNKGKSLCKKKKKEEALEKIVWNMV